MHLSTISPKVFLSPKVFDFNQIYQFLMFFGGHKVAKILYIAIYIYSPMVTMVNSAIVTMDCLRVGGLIDVEGFTGDTCGGGADYHLSCACADACGSDGV